MVVILVMIMLAVALSSFFIFQSGTEISKADAQRVFGESCIEYEKKQCSWDVTEQQGFGKFVESCKVLFGQEREALTCLYSLCGRCKSFELEDLHCRSVCQQVQALSRNGGASDTAALCEQYRTEAQCGSVQCGACA